MSKNRFVTRRTSRGREPKIGRMMVVSLLIHLVIVGFSAHKLFPEFKTRPRPVYYVDLKQKPVASPQKGIPQKSEKKSRPVAEKTPSVKKSTPKKQKSSVAEKVYKSKSTPKTPVAPIEDEGVAEFDEDAVLALLNKDSKKSESPSPANEDLQREIERMRSELDGLTASRSDAPDVPLGSETGTGNEPGVDEREWIEAYLKKQWRFSRYQLDERRLARIEAVVELEYQSDGALKIYKFIDTSGDQLFDDSVKAAIIKGRQLPFNPGRKLKFTARFNLKDLSS